MRIAATSIAVLALVGAAALHYGFTRSELGEWWAGRLPYPGIGVSSSDSFDVRRGGRFELQILSACTEQERTDAREEKVGVGLRVVIVSAHRFRIDKVINTVQVGSWGASGRTFSANQVWVLPSGEYDIRIEGRQAVPAVFRERGAVIYLERMEDVGPGLGFALEKVVGYSSLVLAAIISLAIAIRRPSRVRLSGA